MTLNWSTASRPNHRGNNGAVTIFPLETPVKLIDLADTQQASLDLWEDKITGLAQNVRKHSAKAVGAPY